MYSMRQALPRGPGSEVEHSRGAAILPQQQVPSRFFKALLGYADESCLKPAIREVVSEFNRMLEAKIKSRRKVI